MTPNLIHVLGDTSLKTGWNPLVENDAELMMDFGLLHIPEKTDFEFHSEKEEIAILLLSGEGWINLEEDSISYRRKSWLDENPLAVHAPKGIKISIQAYTHSEFAIVKTVNPESFTPHIYLPDGIAIDHRGKGILNDACYRLVRTVFDRSNAPDKSLLVLGEVVNYPGRWSSYPPHHHIQPELYYYRFSPEWGYGHGELGENVYKIRHHDVLRIIDNQDHSQTSAPGVTMYYLWAIRHLPDNPYTGFEYTPPFETLFTLP